MIPNTKYACAHTHIHNSLGDTQTGVFLFISYRVELPVELSGNQAAPNIARRPICAISSFQQALFGESDQMPRSPKTLTQLPPKDIEGFSWCLSGKIVCQYRRCGFDPWVGKIPWRRKWQPTPVFLPGKSHGERSLAGYSPWGCRRVRYNLGTKEIFERYPDSDQQVAIISIGYLCYNKKAPISQGETLVIAVTLITDYGTVCIL